MLNLEGFKSNGTLGVASYCNGDCCICKGGDSRCCIADTYSFEEATKEQVVNRLNSGRYADNRDLMIDFLKRRYNFSNFHHLSGET